MVNFVRSQTKLGLMANKEITESLWRKFFINYDIILLTPRWAKASRLRAGIKSVAMLNEKVVIYKTDGLKLFFEILFKFYEWNPDFI